jgi:hypothetical protein
MGTVGSRRCSDHMGQRHFLLLFTLALSGWPAAQSVATQSSVGADSDNAASLNLPFPDRTHVSTAGRKGSDVWVPPDVDNEIPAVDPKATCSLDDVLSRAGERVGEFVHNLDRFRATEVIEHQHVDRSGRLHHRETDKFDYLVSITPESDGLFDIEEYRKGYSGFDEFPDHVDTRGVPTLILIFYPPYSKGFDMQCEGLGRWHGQPAWQVHFEEKRDEINHMCSIQIGGRSWLLRLRGRAWILADSYQVARLETDLEDTVPQIRLRLQHEDIQYAPVYFSQSKVEMWLPSTADLYMDFVGHRFYRRETYTDFQLFSVSAHQVIGSPKPKGAK